jgi:hypothetical protein
MSDHEPIFPDELPPLYGKVPPDLPSPETLPDKLARLIRENPGMPVVVRMYKPNFIDDKPINRAYCSNGEIIITIGTHSGEK